MVGGILSTEQVLNEEQRLALRKSWEARHAGGGNAFKTAVLWGGMTIRFRTGWPAVNGASSTPDAIKSWLLCRVTGLYEQRESFAARSVSALPGDFLDGLLDPWRVCGVV